ncbi:hypothetical protein PV326_001507, partial [Microctonus aethiopoides]
RPTSSRLNNKISDHISASVTPLHDCLEVQGGPELGSCNAVAGRAQVKGSKEHLGDTTSVKSWETEIGSNKIALEDWSQPSMANTISNMKMTNPIKGLVSKRRKRFTEDGFDLDLTYIRDNLIAMGFPAEKLEGVYRNHIDDVVKFLESKHKDHYRIYNLCSERSYDCKKFKHRVAMFPFDDHNPPKVEIIKPFCDDVDKWLSQDRRNVAAVHCKAGKGRTGVMVCCYLLHIKQFNTAAEALDFYGRKRTTDTKGVTIPSQRRYVEYYATLVQEGLVYQPVTLILRQIHLDPVPIFNGGQGYLHFVISESNKRIFTSDIIEVKKGMTSICIPLKNSVPLTGDIRIDFFNKKPKMKRKDKMFHFWFNTFFVRDISSMEYDNGDLPVERSTRALSCDGTTMDLPIVTSNSKPRTSSLANLGPTPPTLLLNIDKWNLDDAHKDKSHKLYSSDFKVKLLMHRQWDCAGSEILQTASAMVPRADVQIGMSDHETPCESSDADSSECDTTGDEDEWESGESSLSPMVKRQPIKHSISRTTHDQTFQHHHHHHHHHNQQEQQRHKSRLGECIQASISRVDKEISGQSGSISKRLSAFARSATFDI